MPHNLTLDPAGGGGDELDRVSFGFGRHIRLHQEIDGGDEGDGTEGLERVNKGLFTF